MKNARKLIVAILILAGLGLVVAGLFLDFMQASAYGNGGAVKLFDGLMKEGTDMTNTIVAFSIMTAAFAFLTLVLTLIGKGKGVRIVCALLTIASAIIAFAVLCAYAADLTALVGGLVAVAPAIGAYLLGAGGVLAGLIGLIPVAKK